MRRTVPSILLVLAVCLSGCAAESVPTAVPSSNVKPQFSGPFSAELEAAWDESESDFVRGVINDQSISDQEWAELGTRMATCLEQYGIRFDGFDDQGGYDASGNTLSGDALEEALSDCETSTGEVWIHGLRLSMSTNPSNAAVEVAMTDCLIRNGAVGPEYTAEQFLKDNPNLSFPFMGTPEEEIFWSCNSNPSYRAD